MMFLLNPEDTRVILIGASEFEDENLSSLPTIKDNNVKLRALLCEVVGISKDNIHILEDREYSDQITSEIRKIPSKGLDIIYYAGHGLPHSKRLYLATRKTKWNDPENSGALLADKLLRIIINKGKAKRIIFIFDCCFSGFAREKIDSFSKEVFLITATSSVETAKSESPENDNYTAFTHELLVILKQGIDGAEEILTLQDIFSCLKERLERKNLPLPRITSYGSPDKLGICKNRTCQLHSAKGSKPKYIPSLLPYLPDRREQERYLGKAIKKHANKQQPFLCVVHGDHDERSDKFLTRLEKDYLPTVDRTFNDLQSYFFNCEICSHHVDELHDILWESLGYRVLGDSFATRDEIANRIAQDNAPVILYTNMSSKDWSRGSGTKMIYEFIKFWADWPVSRQNHLFMVFLFFNYKDIEKKWFFKFFQSSTNSKIKKAFQKLQGTDFLEKFNVHGVVLPELLSIEIEHVENWIDGYASDFCEPDFLRQEVGKIFTSAEQKIAMEPLARQLKEILKKCEQDDTD